MAAASNILVSAFMVGLLVLAEVKKLPARNSSVNAQNSSVNAQRSVAPCQLPASLEMSYPCMEL
jgi:hypothetical protein